MIGILGAFLNPNSASTQIANTLLAPESGPAKYVVNDAVTRAPAPQVKFAKSTRAVKVASQLKTGDSPGPAKYNTTTKFGSAPKHPASRFATAKQRPRPEESIGGSAIISANHARENLSVWSPGPKYYHESPPAGPQFSMAKNPHCMPQKSKASGITDKKRKKEMKRVSNWVTNMIGPDVHVPRSQSEKSLSLKNSKLGKSADAFGSAVFTAKRSSRS
jgi:hypothetical protein